MPIQFTCLHCGHQTLVADQFLGQTGPCANCGKPITITAPVVAPSMQPAAGAYAVPPKRSSAPIFLLVLAVVLMGALVCGGVLVALMLPAVQAAREAARRVQCMNNLKQIGLALHCYHDTFGCFPPAYIPDENGRPKHSWRVLILPYLEKGYLYDMYDFDEPWDSPGNLVLLDMMPDVYRCLSDGDDVSSETSYMMIVGPGTISDGPTPCRLRDVRDGLSNTIAVVEVAHSRTNWLEPQDLDSTTLSYKINDPLGGGISSNHPDGANILFADGSVRFVNDTTSSDEVAAMSTIAGGEETDPDFSGFDF